MHIASFPSKTFALKVFFRATLKDTGLDVDLSIFSCVLTFDMFFSMIIQVFDMFCLLKNIFCLIIRQTEFGEMEMLMAMAENVTQARVVAAEKETVNSMATAENVIQEMAMSMATFMLPI